MASLHSVRRNHRRGGIVVLAAFFMMVFVAFVALAVDTGYICVVRTELQAAADAASMAACQDLAGITTVTTVKERAKDYAALNVPQHGETLKDTDIRIGTWNHQTRAFQEGTSGANAVEVTLRRGSANQNALALFFGRALGHNQVDVAATAIASLPQEGAKFRFLIDDEILDSDVPGIQALAAEYNKTPDWLLRDNNNDGWIDMPAGESVEVPTGQVGDEGLFDRAKYEGAFPFKKNSKYTTKDFLAHDTALREVLGTKNLKDVEWNASDAPHPSVIGKKILDPVVGTDVMDSHSDIMSLPNPQATLVSPVFKSDVSIVARDTLQYGSPGADIGNLQGERRGLVAFKIMSARSNPAGGSYLPLLTIEFVDPTTIDLDDLAPDTGAKAAANLVK